MASLIDWPQARTTAKALTKPGPDVSARDITATVSMLRVAMSDAGQIAHEHSGLATLGDAREMVIDRYTWIDKNIETIASLIDDEGHSNIFSGVTRHARGHTIGLTFALLASRVLGQFDPFTNSTLVLVAPTILEVQRELDLPARDFGLWVALHEQTHRVQFANAPWMSDHMRRFVEDFSDETLSLAPGELKTSVETLRRSLADGNPISLAALEAFMTPQAWDKFQDISAMMSVLEGYADVIMDRAASEVISDVDTIRRRFNARRNQNGVRQVVNRMSGMSVKLAQYADGAKFCQAVIEEGGMHLLNRVFIGPEYMPSQTELHAPESWVHRVG